MPIASGEPVEHPQIVAGDDDDSVFVRPIGLPQDHAAVFVPSDGDFTLRVDQEK
jgi:hypothetical protein